MRGVPPGDPRLLPGQLAGLFDLRRQQWRTVQFIADPHRNEKGTARELVYALPPRSLILCDLGFFGFDWFDDLTDHAYYFTSRLRQKTRYVVRHTFYAQGDTFDGLVRLGQHRADRAKHAVRLVRFRHNGTLHTYLTNVLDPTLLSLVDIATLYARRWDFELAANLVKRYLHLHLLWSAKDTVIQQQLWAVLIISQILRAFRLEIAGRAQVDPFEPSMDLLVRWLPPLAHAGQDPITVFVEQGRAVRFIRPSTRLTIRAPTIPPGEMVPRPPISFWSGPPSTPSATVANVPPRNQLRRPICWSRWIATLAPTWRAAITETPGVPACIVAVLDDVGDKTAGVAT